MHGFLGTGATFWADLNLVIQIAMGVALLGGMALARRQHFRAHMVCQSSVVLLNLVLICVIMLPAFRRQVVPQLPAGLQEAYYAVVTLHAGLGTVAELLGLYIVLRAATNLVPARLRFQNYKVWMRTALGLWWGVVLLGVGTYAIWYFTPAAPVPLTAPGVAAPPGPAPVNRITVTITNFAFQPQELTVPAGTTVVWVTAVGHHTVWADDGAFQSDTLRAGEQFEHTFEQPGVVHYYCDNHGDKGGKDMAGVLTVTPRTP
jgi:plastocyanin/uncharacterized membrane protein YozB (DUF420 family)